jgi:tRNA modification GTPase
VEISCHGSRYILHTVLDLLMANGCRMAKPGEFTRRAFLNGKMDLSQAEAVADVIASDSAASHRVAMNQMRGNFSKALRALRDQLLHLTSLMELELDFSDHEELEFADRSQLLDISNQVQQTISKLANSFKLGNALKNGIPVAIVGETNAGKSTLLNALLGDDKAIVSDVHGTTRDVIEDTINVRGVTFRFIDTAGIRHTDDPVESIGIARSYQKMEQAEIILWVVAEAMANDAPLLQKIKDIDKEKKVLLLFNKSDILSESDRSTLAARYTDLGIPHLFISAKCGQGLSELEETLSQIADLPQYASEDTIVTNLRHYEALISALHAIERVQYGMQSGLSGDFISQDLRECIHHLSDIIGEVSTDSVLQNIFKHFCIGK